MVECAVIFMRKSNMRKTSKKSIKEKYTTLEEVK